MGLAITTHWNRFNLDNHMTNLQGAIVYPLSCFANEGMEFRLKRKTKEGIYIPWGELVSASFTVKATNVAGGTIMNLGLGTGIAVDEDDLIITIPASGYMKHRGAASYRVSVQFAGSASKQTILTGVYKIDE